LIYSESDGIERNAVAKRVTGEQDMAEQREEKRNRKADGSEGPAPAPFTRQKLPARFVDDIANISISPNGACRLHFCTWSTDEQGQPLRIDTELILTRSTLNTLAEALPRALAQADESLAKTTNPTTGPRGEN